jgi:hypothetical protein
MSCLIHLNSWSTSLSWTLRRRIFARRTMIDSIIIWLMVIKMIHLVMNTRNRIHCRLVVWIVHNSTDVVAYDGAIVHRWVGYWLAGLICAVKLAALGVRSRLSRRSGGGSVGRVSISLTWSWSYIIFLSTTVDSSKLSWRVLVVICVLTKRVPIVTWGTRWI